MRWDWCPTLLTTSTNSTASFMHLGVLVVAFVLEYDQTDLAASGLHSPPTTPTEWLEYTEKLTIPAKHQFGNYNVNTAASGADMWFAVQNFPLGWNGAWAKGSKLTIDSKECIASMEFFVKLVKASGLLGTAETIQQKLWDNDQIATLYSVALGASTLKAAAPKLYPNLRHRSGPRGQQEVDFQAAHDQHPEDFVEHPGRTRAGEVHRDAEEPLVYRLHQRLPPDPLQQLLRAWSRSTSRSSTRSRGRRASRRRTTSASTMRSAITCSPFAQMGNIISTQLERALSGSATVTEALQTAQSTAQESLHVPK